MFLPFQSYYNLRRRNDLADLPDFILQSIILFACSSPSAIANCERVCKKWHLLSTCNSHENFLFNPWYNYLRSLSFDNNHCSLQNHFATCNVSQDEHFLFKEISPKELVYSLQGTFHLLDTREAIKWAQANTAAIHNSSSSSNSSNSSSNSNSSSSSSGHGSSHSLFKKLQFSHHKQQHQQQQVDQQQQLDQKQKQHDQISLNIAVVGFSGSGKTSLALRYVTGEFVEEADENYSK